VSTRFSSDWAARLLRPLALAGVVLGIDAGALGCRGQTSVEPPIVPIRNMYSQDRYDPQSESQFFLDRRTMRPAVPDTVPRERELNTEIGQGRLQDDSAYVLEPPKAVVDHFANPAQMLDRGQERYNIYCSPCHDGTGGGQGLVVTRANWQPPPPTFHQDRLRKIPDGQLFATITHGVRLMPAYAARIPVHDRWAIVSYVRALQLSQGE
jgi:mono/diheme cytochrome c family protein